MAPGHVIERSDFNRLFEALSKRGHTTIGPTVRDQAIVYDEIRSDADLPVGRTDEQDGGRYRLRRRGDEALFGYAVGPHSWKRYQLPPELKLWQARWRVLGSTLAVNSHLRCKPRSPRLFRWCSPRPWRSRTPNRADQGFSTTRAAGQPGCLRRVRSRECV